ncbi:MAG: alanine:cation symporter family protein [Rickettsiales bacterium]|nr:alanine:cation symporter family protein [Rickettsiales bacterium]
MSSAAYSPPAILQNAFTHLTDGLSALLFYPVPLPFAPDGFPLLVLWMAAGGLFFTLYFRFANLRLLPHAVTIVFRSKQEAKGEISSFQALAAALSGTVGLGNIAGVAVSVSIGGPGAVVWMIVAAFLGTASKLAEVTIGHLYRVTDAEGKISGGPFYYLRDGLRDRGWPRLGKALSIAFCFCCMGGAMGGGNMLQSNQAVASLAGSFPIFVGYEWALSLILAVMTGITLMGGIQRIANVAGALVPLMAIIYVLACLIVLYENASLIPAAMQLMLHHALTPEAAGGGMVGALIMGLRRAFFSCEAGIGSTPIAHAPSRAAYPAQEGCVALLEPMIDTVLICTMTGLVLVVTGVYTNPANGSGVVLTAAAFATVIPWFPKVLAVCVVLFAFSTMMTWSYYGERAWVFLFGTNHVQYFYAMFCALAFLGGILSLGPIVDFGDLLILAMAIPNGIGLLMMRQLIRQKVEEYRAVIR